MFIHPSDPHRPYLYSMAGDCPEEENRTVFILGLKERERAVEMFEVTWLEGLAL